MDSIDMYCECFAENELKMIERPFDCECWWDLKIVYCPSVSFTSVTSGSTFNKQCYLNKKSEDTMFDSNLTNNRLHSPANGNFTEIPILYSFVH